MQIEVGGEIVIHRAAVLGAGVMGSQIAALLANVGVDVDLLDLPTADGPNELAKQGIERALKVRPAAFYSSESAARVKPGTLDDLSCLNEADWVIEAIVENMLAKQELLARVEDAVSKTAVISTNTSGLPIEAMAAGSSPSFRHRFLGIHFFNPPRHMKLVEVVPGPDTRPETVEAMRSYLEGELGKGIVVCRDTPNFIANRLGVFAIMDALHRMEEEGLTVEEVDAVTGTLLGRPTSATLRLCDLIGLDTLANVATTSFQLLPADEEGVEVYRPPRLLERMLAADLLGEKGGQGGFYLKDKGQILALDVESLTYRERQRPELGSLADAIGQRRLVDRLSALWDLEDERLAAWARAHLVSVLNYSLTHAAEMASSVSDIDRVMQWGFNWEAGPFRLADHIGAHKLASAVRDGEASAPAAVLDAVQDAAAGSRFYILGDAVEVDGSAPAAERALSLDSMEHEAVTIAEPEDSRLMARAERVELAGPHGRVLVLPDDEGILVLSGKLNVIPPAGLELLRSALALRPWKLLILYGHGANFSAGADLQYVVQLIEGAQWQELEDYVRAFQEATMAVRFAGFPVVAAARGLALGGGCELCLAADARVVAAELRMGLVESRVGLLPGAGGCKEMVRRFGAHIEAPFETLLNGGMTDNAHQARSWGMLGEADGVFLNSARVLGAALDAARRLHEAGYSAPEPQVLMVAGASVRQRLEDSLDERHAAGRIPAHDVAVGRALARVLCGGAGEATPSELDEQQILDLEREAFLELCGTSATAERVVHMLNTGKPLRN